MRKRIEVQKVSKAYEGQQVLKEFSYTFDADRVTCIMGSSGIGKTTLIRILLKLEEADEGTVADGNMRYSAVFQENRLVEQLSAIANVKLAMDGSIGGSTGSSTGSRELEQDMSQILPAECFYKKVSELSGGMKRRIAVIRAMLAESDAVILDEPFTGLDVQTKQEVREYITSHARGRIIIIVTHDEEDVLYFNAVKCLLTTAQVVVKL